MATKIPLTRPYFDSEELQEVKGVLNSGWVTSGPKVKELERNISDYLGTKYAVAVSNCTSALHLALLSIGIKEGDDVLVADYTFPATGYAVLYCRANPIFVDIDPKTYNINPDLIEEKITDKTKAIIPVHTFGQPSDMDKIMKIANKHNLKVIEDAACALGAKYKNKFAGTIGDIGCFSLHARKGITTGEGGIAVTNKRDLAQKMRSLSVFGMNQPAWEREKETTPSVSEFMSLGYNYKMSDITAAIGIAQLRKLNKIIKRKKTLAKYWDKKLKNLPSIRPPYVSKNVTHVYQSYVALLSGRIERNKTIETLLTKGVQTQIGTYASHVQSAYNSKDKCPNSLDIFKTALALPIYYTLNKKDIDKAARTIKKVLEGKA